MKIKISKRIFEAVEIDISSFFSTSKPFNYAKIETINLTGLTAKRLDTIEELLEPHSKIRGCRAAIRDIKTFRKLDAGETSTKPRSVEIFTSVLKAYLRDVPGHRIYRKAGEVWEAYYVAEVSYQPPQKRRDSDSPPTCTMTLVSESYGSIDKTSATFRARDCVHKTVIDALAGNYFYAETDELRADYLERVAKFDTLVGKIGLRVECTGFATPDLDGNPDEYRWSREGIDLAPGGVASMGVIDVYQEGDSRRHQDAYYPSYFWQGGVERIKVEGDDPDFDDDDETEVEITDGDQDAENALEIPIHPTIPFFHFGKHLRMGVDVCSMEIAPYDTGIGSHLVLDDQITELVDVLVNNTLDFRDVVRGKSGGTVILCAGAPGIGKTLTSEVFSETVERPLFSVQCSQLGTRAKELESELLKIFMRALRWNAILLLDEADVYIARRGTDLNQNAIVGVFLRVLEYYSGVLFLTTNRGDTVDDAIASRCVARIDYKSPTQAQQKKIWHVLSKTSGIKLAPGLVDTVAELYPSLTGRDVKNLIKLGAMISKGEAVTLETIKLAKRFKPTADHKVVSKVRTKK